MSPVNQRKYRLSLGRDDSGNGDMEDWLLWKLISRWGDTDVFWETNPERILLMQEDEWLDKAERDLQIAAAKRLCNALTSRLTPRQYQVLVLRVAGYERGEIAVALDVSIRTIDLEWKAIKEIASDLIKP